MFKDTWASGLRRVWTHTQETSWEGGRWMQPTRSFTKREREQERDRESASERVCECVAFSPYLSRN